MPIDPERTKLLRDKMLEHLEAALPLAAEAFEEDCRRAALMVSLHTAPPSCNAMKIDRSVWPGTGASAPYWKGKGFATVGAYPPGYDRPWAKAVARREGAENASGCRRRPAMRRRERRIWRAATERDGAIVSLIERSRLRNRQSSEDRSRCMRVGSEPTLAIDKHPGLR